MKISKQSVLGTIVLACVFLSGCANIGNSAITDDQKISSIKVGKSTTRDVEALLGRPGNVDLTERGEQVWQYQHVEMNGIPFASMFGSAGKESTLSIRFNKKGIVKAVGRGENHL